MIRKLVYFFYPYFIMIIRWRDLIRKPSVSWSEFESYCDRYRNLPVASEEVIRLIHEDLLDDFVYAEDGIDYPKHPRTTLAVMTGDCDDFSTLIHAILSRVLPEFEPTIVAVYNIHTVCRVTIGGKFYHVSNWPGIWGPYESMRDFCYSVNPNWSRAYIVTSNVRILEEIER